MLIDLEGKFHVTFDTIFGNKRGKVCSKKRDYVNRKLIPYPDAPAMDIK